MFQIHPIESLDLPALSPYRTLRRPEAHRQQGLFVAEGEKVVRRLLESEFPVVSVLLPEKRLASFRPLLESRQEGELPVFIAREKLLLEQLVGFALFQGVLAVGRIPATLTLDQVLQRSARPWLFAAVEALTNAENLGVIVRNCVAFGVQALWIGETSSSPFLRRAVRNSMGTIFRLPVVEPPSLSDELRRLQAAGVRCVAAHPHTDQRRLSQADFRSDCCILLGSEGCGITPSLLAECDEAVAIPMPPGVDSLNVGSAAAVLFYEAARQRNGT